MGNGEEAQEAGHADYTCSLEDIDHDEGEPPDERGPMLCSTPAKCSSHRPSRKQNCGSQAAPHTGSYNNGAPPVDRHTHYSLPPHIRQDGDGEGGEEQQALLSQHTQDSTATSHNRIISPHKAEGDTKTTTKTTSGDDIVASTHDSNTRRLGCQSPPHNSLANRSSEHQTNSQSRSQGNSHGLAGMPNCRDASLNSSSTGVATNLLTYTTPQDAVVHLSSAPHRTANYNSRQEQVL